MVEPTPELLDALRLAKAQCLIRVTQLASCRVCGDDQRRFDKAVQQLNQLIKDLEGHHATDQELSSG